MLLTQLQPNIEKDLCQRFLWVCPRPTVTFGQLQHINDKLSSSIGEGIVLFCFNAIFLQIASLMSDLWVPNKTIRKWVLPRRSADSVADVQEMVLGHFQQKYDEVQTMIMKIGCMDEL